MTMQEHEYEPIPGLPEELPAGEYVVWQGSPAWRALASRVFYTEWLGAYFIALILIHLIYQVMNGAGWAEILVGAGWQLMLASIAIGLLVVAARAYAKKALITFTNRRLVLRSGVALPMMVNIPWDSVASAGLRVCKDGTGDILITPKNDRKYYYFLLWPFVKPWRFGRVQPLLRGIENPQWVASRLAEVIGEEREQSTPLRPVAAEDDGMDDFNDYPLPAS